MGSDITLKTVEILMVVRTHNLETCRWINTSARVKWTHDRGGISAGILDSIVVSIPACHAGDRGSIPRRGEHNFCLNTCDISA